MWLSERQLTSSVLSTSNSPLLSSSGSSPKLYGSGLPPLSSGQLVSVVSSPTPVLNYWADGSAMYSSIMHKPCFSFLTAVHGTCISPRLGRGDGYTQCKIWLIISLLSELSFIVVVTWHKGKTPNLSFPSQMCALWAFSFKNNVFILDFLSRPH